MGVVKRKREENVIKKEKIKEEMAEWFKASDCKSVEFSHHRFESYSLHILKNFNSETWRSFGSALVLGTRGHVFKSHCFEKFVLILNE